MIQLSWEADQDNRFRLVSLREIMDAINGDILVSVGDALMQLRVPNQFRQFAGRSLTMPPDAIDRDMSPQTRTSATTNLQYVKNFCEQVGCGFTLSAVNRAMTRLQVPGVSLSEMASDSDHIYQLLIDELNSKLFLNTYIDHIPYYNSWRNGWGSVIDNFPSSERDVEEAAKCFALNRFDASVFHLMRIMEVGLRVFAVSLNDQSINPKTNPTWDRILRRCRTELSKNLQDRSPEWRKDEPFYSNASTRLMGVKDAWRNPTMHVEHVYTEETSLDVFNHVQAFMRHLATKLHE